MCESVEPFRAEKQRNALKCILPWLCGYLLVIQACVDFTNNPGRPAYLLDAIRTVSSMNTNSSNVGQMKTVWKAKGRVCLCVFDRDGERKPKTGTAVIDKIKNGFHKCILFVFVPFIAEKMSIYSNS